ncbi:hypothetical protein RSPO_m00177 (plasmid) [Ralstonia solanacearum Po82]|uniref:Uncharacterized protein n=1 Tax=Ralstonia solanacearum (strain Po82) TaxID=1031711 RepID=F6G868_RALS8|nr:hypothetical protein RSPO_m00177 [Ralstonia solanacearum Po82]
MQSSGNPNPDKTTRRQRHETGTRRPPSPGPSAVAGSSQTAALAGIRHRF